MKRYIYLVLLIIVFLSVSSCGRDKRLQYKNRVFQFLLRYNPEWEAREKVDPSTPVVFVAPISGDADSFQENLTIIVQELIEKVSLEKYSATMIAHIKSISGMEDVDLNIIQSKEIKIAGIVGHQVVYTVTQYGNPPEFVENDLAPKIDTEGETLQIMAAWVMKEERVYLFTYIAEKENYKTYLKDVEGMLQSFRFM